MRVILTSLLNYIYKPGHTIAIEQREGFNGGCKSGRGDSKNRIRNLSKALVEKFTHSYVE